MSGRLSSTKFLEGRASKLLLAALFAITVLTGALTSPAQAKLQGAGPVDPSNGFPYWYQDEGGTRLDLCLDPQDQNCLQPFEMPNPEGPVSFPDNFPGEAFWWVGDTSMTMSNGADAVLVMAQEATFANDEAKEGDQASFGRIRVRLDGLEPGQTYRVTHPYGVEEVVAGDDGSVFATEDTGCLLPTPQSPCKFGASDESLSGRIGPFLRWDEGAPSGYLGDPNVPHAVTGSPNGTNFFRVEKLDADGAVVEQLGETDQFTVSGKLASPQVNAAPRRDVFNAAEDVTLVPSDPSYDVFYTTDGSDPSDPANAGRKAYTAPIHLDAAAGQVEKSTIRFVAQDASGKQSKVMEKTYTIDKQAPSPSANPGSGTYEAAQDVTLSTGASADKIFYTTDGSDPQVNVTSDPASGTSIDVINGTEYGAPLKVARSQTIKILAVDEAGNKSQIETYRYTIASLVAKGPHNPATGTDPNGFPFWYKDANGVKLELCLDPNDQNCLQPFEMPDATQPVSFPDNFPGEAFWWAGDTSMTMSNGADAILVMGQEATFTNGNPKDGDQASFGRVRIRVDGLQVGQKYRVSQPYGTQVYTATDNGLGSGEINVTDDIGCFGTAAAPCDFDAARFSSVGPFLTWDTYGTDSPDAPPAGYVGDPNLEAGHKVKGSPVTDAAGNPQNYFEVEQQNADGTYTQMGRTEDFIVTGKVARMQVEAGKAGGSYKAPQDVLLRASEPDATIYYTTDGSEPTTASPNHFVGEGTVPQVADATLKFVAVGADGSQSRVHTETYATDTIAPTVSANPQGGTYDGPQDVTLSTGDAKDKIYYTKGALGAQVPDPTQQSTLYSAPIRVAAPTTIKAIAVDRAGNQSNPKTFNYDVVIPPAAPSSPVQNLSSFDQIGVKAPLATSTLPVTLNWNASPSNGVTSYQVQQSVNGGQFADVPAGSQSGTTTAAKLNLAMGTLTAPNKYQFRVRACAGPACSTWAAGPTFTLLPVDEGAVNSGFLARIGFNGKWTTENVAGSYGGTVRHSSTAKDKAQLNKITFTTNGNFAWLSTLGPNRGLASVTVDGGPAQTVDLYSPTLKPARVAFAANNLAGGTEHTVTVQVLGTRNPASTGTRVDVDGFVAIF